MSTKSAMDLIASRLAAVPDVARMVGTFISYSNGYALVNVGDQSIEIPCVGFAPPTPGMFVQLERRNGQLILAGPATPVSSVGTVTAAAFPKSWVSVAGVPYLLPNYMGFSPTNGDIVTIDWSVPIIVGKMSAYAAPVNAVPGINPPPGLPPLSLTTPILAQDSGQWDIASSTWVTREPTAYPTASGAWFYGNRAKDYLRASTPTSIEIYLPFRQQMGGVNIGVHPYGTVPGGWVGQSLTTALGAANFGGWYPLPLTFANYLRDNVSGISVTAQSSGMCRWAGVPTDPYSGSLRFAGTRA